MAANIKTSKSTPHHVIFKKISRDKSVSGTEVSGLFAYLFFKGIFSRIDMINAKIYVCFLSLPEMDDK